MDIPLNAHVRCANGDGGRTTRVVLNPLTREVTHIVVREPGLLGVERLVPVESIATSTPQEVHIRLTRGELATMQRFITDEFVTVPSLTHGDTLHWPYFALGGERLTLHQETIAPEELAVRRGYRVEATNGLIGRVDGFLVDPLSNRISHLVLREGHLWGAREVTLPVTQIARIDDRAVHLTLDKDAVEALPAIPVVPPAM